MLSKTKKKPERNLKRYDKGLEVAESIVHGLRKRSPHSINGQYYNIVEIKQALEAIDKMRELTK